MEIAGAEHRDVDKQIPPFFLHSLVAKFRKKTNFTHFKWIMGSEFVQQKLLMFGSLIASKLQLMASVCQLMGKWTDGNFNCVHALWIFKLIAISSAHK